MGNTLSTESTYDFECDIKGIADVWEVGWFIESKPAFTEHVKTNFVNWNYPVVAVVGLYNKGKTTVLNMLTNTNFKANSVHRTKALSFKLLTTKGRKYIFLDSAGMHSPVEEPGPSSSDQTAKKETEEQKEEIVEKEKLKKRGKQNKERGATMLPDQLENLRETEDVEQEIPNSPDQNQQKEDYIDDDRDDGVYRYIDQDLMNNQVISAIAAKKATENFLQELIFRLADIIIVVVNDLTVLDQEYLQTMAIKMQTSGGVRVKQMFLVHNFRDCTDLKDAQIRWKQQVQDIFKSGRSETEQVAASKNPDSAQLTEVDVHVHESAFARHIFILNSESDSGKNYNNWSIAKLKSWLAASTAVHAKPYDPWDKIMRISRRLIKSYVDNPGELIKQQQPSRSCIWMTPPTEGEPKLKRWKLDGFTIIIDSSSTFQKEQRPKVDICERVDAKGPKNYDIYIELPGIGDNEGIQLEYDKESVTIIAEKKGSTKENQFFRSAFMVHLNAPFPFQNIL